MPINTVHQEVDDDDNDLIAHIYKKYQTEEQNKFELYLKAFCVPWKADIL